MKTRTAEWSQPPHVAASVSEWSQLDPQHRGRERERVDPSSKGHLPRLPHEWYRGQAFVHWTLAIQDRATGWLSPGFHHRWDMALLHCSARHHLACPAYTLMPDHIHVLWLGLDERGSDQRIAIEFLRKHTAAHLQSVTWQRQPYDHVLRQGERRPDSVSAVAEYILDNAVRAGLVARRKDWIYSGNCVPGYPELELWREDYWELFWRIYNRAVADCSLVRT